MVFKSSVPHKKSGTAIGGEGAVPLDTVRSRELISCISDTSIKVRILKIGKKWDYFRHFLAKKSLKTEDFWQKKESPRPKIEKSHILTTSSANTRFPSLGVN